jgi:hypothetical protein
MLVVIPSFSEESVLDLDTVSKKMIIIDVIRLVANGWAPILRIYREITIQTSPLT